MAIGCSWFFILLLLVVLLCLLPARARAAIRGDFSGVLGALAIVIAIALIVASIWNHEAGGAPLLFAFLLLGTAVVLALRGSKSAVPFFGAPDQRRWCPTCGNPLPANAPHGICPRCLLRQGLQSPPPQAA